MHFDDLARLLEVLHRLVDMGNTVVVIEHNLDVVKSADWVIDMGPEAGNGGGLIVAEGTPEDIAAHTEKVVPARTSSGRRKTRDGSDRQSRKRQLRRTGAGGDSVPFRSHTGEALCPVLQAGPHAERQPSNLQADLQGRQGDMDISDVGRHAKIPWEADGRRWHTQDRVGRRGEPCRWDGKILDQVVDRIHKLGRFSSTDWNARSVVEIAAEKKTDGWFFHAITGEAWLLKLKFRVARNTFKRELLVRQLDLKPLNELDDLPVYGNGPRVKCKNLRGPWQEVQVDVHWLAEIDTPAFWKFLATAAGGFFRLTERAAERPEDLMPWKKLGQKWHFSRKGFPPGKRVLWDLDVLEEVYELLSQASPDGQFLWNNQQVVHLLVPSQREPWATIYTKRPAWLDLVLTGPKDRFTLGRVAKLARHREMDTLRPDRDFVKLKFRSTDDLREGDLTVFLNEHLQEVREHAHS